MFEKIVDLDKDQEELFREKVMGIPWAALKDQVVNPLLYSFIDTDISQGEGLITIPAGKFLTKLFIPGYTNKTNPYIFSLTKEEAAKYLAQGFRIYITEAGKPYRFADYEKHFLAGLNGVFVYRSVGVKARYFNNIDEALDYAELSHGEGE